MIWIIFYTVIILFLNREEATAQCLKALTQWYETMIPALFPMMLLSSVLVDTGFAGKIGRLLNKTLLPFLHISDNGCYCLVTGFLCGFPMGAKTTSDMLKNGQISRAEASYLISFINCIGPMYTVNLTHRLFPGHELWKLLVGIYALPFVYGIFQRYLLQLTEHRQNTNTSRSCFKKKKNSDTAKYSATHKLPTALASAENKVVQSAPPISLLDALYESVPKCGKSILMLGGYMILFQTFFITLKQLLFSISVTTNALYPLVEITGGLFLQPESTALPEILMWNTWGGACCMLQTYSFLKPAGLSMKSYIFHKTVLALLAYILGILLHQI